MSTGAWYPVAPAAAGRRRRLSAAGLAVVASALAAIGQSGALVLYAESSPAAGETTMVQVRTGWSWLVWSTEPGHAASASDQFVIPWFFTLAGLLWPADPDLARLLERTAMAPAVGGLITLGAVLALVVAILLLASGSRPLRAAPSVAAFAAGLLVGGAASIGFDVAAELGDARGPGSPWQVVQVGAGTWLVLAASLVALVVAVLVAGLPALPRHPRAGVALLLPAVAAVAVGACFGEVVAGRGISTGSPWTSSYSEAGSEYGLDIPLVAPTESAPLLGVPLGAGAVLALVAALAMVLRAGRSAHVVRGWLLGVGVCGLVVAVAAHIWLDLAAAMRNARVLVAAGQDVVVGPGPGAWLVLAAAVIATVVTALSLVRA
jgi:hypothetical protein